MSRATEPADVIEPDPALVALFARPQRITRDDDDALAFIFNTSDKPDPFPPHTNLGGSPNMTTTKTTTKTKGPQIVRTYEVVLFPILDGTPNPELAHKPVQVRLSYKPGTEPADRNGLLAKAEALSRAIRLERRHHNGFKSGVDFDAVSIRAIREHLETP